jgi:hypothetical protein
MLRQQVTTHPRRLRAPASLPIPKPTDSIRAALPHPAHPSRAILCDTAQHCFICALSSLLAFNAQSAPRTEPNAILTKRTSMSEPLSSGHGIGRGIFLRPLFDIIHEGRVISRGADAGLIPNTRGRNAAVRFTRSGLVIP